jgi:hypothetical protein
MKAFLLIALAGAVLLWYLLPHRPALPPTPSQRARRPAGVTLHDYRGLNFQARADQPPTTYVQAAAQLGEGMLVDTSADGRTRTYQWKGGGRWARLEASFRGGQLVSKMQFLLYN